MTEFSASAHKTDNKETGNRTGDGETVTAAVLLIGDELLSGRTRDANLGYMATYLNETGVQVREARVIPDVRETIVETLNILRERYDYVFTTGGIGPTHDDITAECVAEAFGLPMHYHPEAMAILTRHYEETGTAFTPVRQRMAFMPQGAILIENAISKAPGFQVANVFVLAGIPMVMQVMLDALSGRLRGGRKMLSQTVSVHTGEGVLAEGLSAVQERYPSVSVGSYPFFVHKQYGTRIVMRCMDPALLEEVRTAVVALVRSVGAIPAEEEENPGKNPGTQS